MRIFLLLAVLTFFGCKDAVTNEADHNLTEKSPVTLLKFPSTVNSALPRLFSNGTDLYASWVTKNDTISTLNYAVYSKGFWSPVEEINSGNDWFVNWADFPQIAENNGNILSSYLQKSATGTYTYDIRLNVYNDSTKTWKKGILLHQDGTQSEHGFVSVKPYHENSFFVSWLDGRNTTGGHDSHTEHGAGAMSLRGAIVFADGTIDYETLLDNRVCDCCNTAAAVGENDAIMVAYRDRSEDEIRDISLVKWEHETNWSNPKTIGSDRWNIKGCPVNGPAMDSFNESVAIAWFTGVNDEGKVQVIFSEDGGNNFGNPIRVDTYNATGRVDLVMLNSSEVAVLWMEPKGSEEVIQLLLVDSNGSKKGPITISSTSPERASGFPQVELVGSTLFIAWTNSGLETSQIEMASVSLKDLNELF